MNERLAHVVKYTKRWVESDFDGIEKREEHTALLQEKNYTFNLFEII